jgi:hypothetical protein
MFLNGATGSWSEWDDTNPSNNPTSLYDYDMPVSFFDSPIGYIRYNMNETYQQVKDVAGNVVGYAEGEVSATGTFIASSFKPIGNVLTNVVYGAAALIGLLLFLQFRRGR